VLLEPYRAIVSEFADELAGSDLKNSYKYEGREHIKDGWNVFLSTYKSFEIMLQRPNVYLLESVLPLNVDECHMVERSPLESIINIFRAINPRANIIAMSGTIIPCQWEWLDPMAVNAARDRGISRVMVTLPANPIN